MPCPATQKAAVCEGVVWDKVGGADGCRRRADEAGGRRTGAHKKNKYPHTKMWGKELTMTASRTAWVKVCAVCMSVYVVQNHCQLHDACGESCCPASATKCWLYVLANPANDPAGSNPFSAQPVGSQSKMYITPRWLFCNFGPVYLGFLAGFSLMQFLKETPLISTTTSSDSSAHRSYWAWGRLSWTWKASGHLGLGMTELSKNALQLTAFELQ